MLNFAGEVPVGAVIVSGDGEVIGASGNAVEATKDASAHAEILAMRLAAEHRGDWRLFDCTLYTTLEPCVMCLNVATQFRLRRLVYGAMSDDRPGVKAQTSLNVLMTGGLLPEESSALLKAFFRSRRLVKHRHPLCSGQGQ
jgi:tRNA(adenine34) deaminase